MRKKITTSPRKFVRTIVCTEKGMMKTKIQQKIFAYLFRVDNECFGSVSVGLKAEVFLGGSIGWLEVGWVVWSDELWVAFWLCTWRIYKGWVAIIELK